MKFKRILTIVLCFLIFLLIGCNNKAATQSSKTVETKNIETTQSNEKNKDNTISNENLKEDRIGDLDLGILTKEEFNKAKDLGIKYKNKNLNVFGTNAIKNSNDKFQQTNGLSFNVWTPYTMVIQSSKEVAENYLDINEENVCNQIIKKARNLNEINCLAMVGGDEIGFINDLNMVLKLYDKNNNILKILQPINILRNELDAQPTQFFPNSPAYYNAIQGVFDAKEFKKINPSFLEVIVIYPNGKEATQKFDCNKINNL